MSEDESASPMDIHSLSNEDDCKEEVKKRPVQIPLFL